MPKKTPVVTGPVLNRGSVTANTKTQRHNAVMWSHMAGKNYDQVKKVEIIKYEVSSIELLCKQCLWYRFLQCRSSLVMIMIRTNTGLN